MLDHLTIQGGHRLQGSTRVSGAKNAALPLLFATLLTEEECRLTNIPDLEDIAVTLRLLRSLGAEASFEANDEGNCAQVRAQHLTSSEAPYGLVKALRASFWALGPLLARGGEARVALPGGDAIGTRPVDLHLKGLTKLGADFRMNHGVVIAHVPGKLHGAKLNLDFPSVGATHNLMMTAALIADETIIDGAAREPEVVALADFLRSMGAEIDGAGTSTIQVRGREQLGGAHIEVLGDRIEAATYLIAGAVTGGEVEVSGIQPEAVRETLHVLEQAGCSISKNESSVQLTQNGRLQATSFETAPHPGLATDVQPLLMAAMCGADGRSVIVERVFDNRFTHVAEYRRFGASIDIDGRVATIQGEAELSGAPVDGLDIRAAAGMVLMGLMAEGQTQVHELHHLDRGYESLVHKLKALGADVARVSGYQQTELVLGC